MTIRKETMSIEAPSIGIETASVGISEAVAAPTSLPATTAPSFESGQPRFGEAGGFHNAEANFSIFADTVAYAPEFNGFNEDRLASFDMGAFETIWSAPETDSSFDSFSAESAIAEAESIFFEANSFGVLSQGEEAILSSISQTEPVENLIQQVEAVDSLEQSFIEATVDSDAFDFQAETIEVITQPEIGTLETALFEASPEAQEEIEVESLMQIYVEAVVDHNEAITLNEEASPFVDYKTAILETLPEVQRNEVELDFAQAAVVVEAMQAVGDTKTEAEEEVIPILNEVLVKKGIEVAVLKEEDQPEPKKEVVKGAYTRDEKANKEREEIALNAFQEVLDDDESVGIGVGYEIAERLPNVPEPDPVRSQILKDKLLTEYKPDGSYIEFVNDVTQIKARTLEDVRAEIEEIILKKPAVKYDPSSSQNQVTEKDVRRVFSGYDVIEAS